MKQKAAKELFTKTQILYDRVRKIALEQLQIDGKLNDYAITNRNGAYYNNAEASAMRLYAFFML